MLGPDLNAPAPEEELVSGDGSGMEGPSVSTAVITTAAAVAVPAAQSSSAAPKSMPEWSAKNVKFWEGDVTWRGKQVCITGLQGYRNFLTPEHLVPNLPQSMDIVRLQPMDTLKSLCTGWLLLLFRANQSHEILARMRNENSYAEIQLPSQTLLLCADEKQHMLLFGLLIHEWQLLQPHSHRRQLQIAAQTNQQQPAAHIKHQQVSQRQQEQPAGQRQELQLEVQRQQPQLATFQQHQPLAQAQHRQLVDQPQQQWQVNWQWQEHQQMLLQVQEELRGTLLLLHHHVHAMHLLQQQVCQGNQQLQPELELRLREAWNQLQRLQQRVHQQGDLFQRLQNL